MGFEIQSRTQALSLAEKFCGGCNSLCGECVFGEILTHYGKGWHCVRVYSEAIKYLGYEDLLEEMNLQRVLEEIKLREKGER